MSSTILQLGSGNEFVDIPGWVNTDKEFYNKHIDVAWDLNDFPWLPFDNESFMVIVALDVLEHLKDVIRSLEECHRILMPDGYMRIRVPNGMNYNFQTDLTHVHPFTKESFDYFIRGTELEKKYGYYSDMRWKLIDFRLDVEEDNLYFCLQKDICIII